MGLSCERKLWGEMGGVENGDGLQAGCGGAVETMFVELSWRKQRCGMEAVDGDGEKSEKSRERLRRC